MDIDTHTHTDIQGHNYRFRRTQRHRHTHNRYKDTQIPSLSPVSEQGGRARDFGS